MNESRSPDRPAWPARRARLVVLISGGGSNLQALLDACAAGVLPAQVVAVVSNKPGVLGLERARNAGVPAVVLEPAAYPDHLGGRGAFDTALADLVAGWQPDWVVLAGWMRLLSMAFLSRFPGRVVNLHPAQPGAFPGVHAIERAFHAYRVGEITETGVMVHGVPDEGVDAGPVLAWEPVPIYPTDTLAVLEARVHAVEHRLLPDTLRRLLAGELSVGELPVPIFHERFRSHPMRVLLSVSDKTGLLDFARGLHALGATLVASGGTANTVADAGLTVIPVSDLTGYPDLLDGRVKTLHPAVHGPILARPTAAHLAELDRHGMIPIDLVVCNLYPFERTVAAAGVREADAVEQIDIGGVTLLRAAAKNFERVAVVVDPADYAPVLAALQGGSLALDQRRSLALKAFRHTAAYDAAISSYLTLAVEGDTATPEVLNLVAERVQALRYGENPHQQAALYRWRGHEPAFVQLQGKELSYNNLGDLDGAWGAANEFETPTVAIIKHANPCGLATSSDLVAAYQSAYACDPVSAFGSIIAVNRTVDMPLVEAIGSLFVEVVAAPDYTADALLRLSKKQNLRVMKATGRRASDAPGRGASDAPGAPRFPLELRTIAGGLLAQTPDSALLAEMRVVSQRQPTPEEMADLLFAWRVAKWVKSNAIVYAHDEATTGVGAGQMSRVDAVHYAGLKAGERAHGSVMSSDAFFPFPDGIEAAATYGITAVIQPGGSMRDDEVIAAADRLGLAMVFTGTRHFRH